MSKSTKANPSRREVLSYSPALLGTSLLWSFATDLPIPVMNSLLAGKAIAAPAALDKTMLIVVSNLGGIRPNDFNIHKTAQPSAYDRDWADGEMVAASHRSGETLMYPPGFGKLADIAGKVAVVAGVDTGSISHSIGNRLSTSNASVVGSGSSLHSLVGEASPFIIKGIAANRTNPIYKGRQGRGLSTSAILRSFLSAQRVSKDIRKTLWDYRTEFHAMIKDKLNDANKKVLDRYWHSNDSYKVSMEKAEKLANEPVPPDTLAGQLSLAHTLYKAGICNCYLVDGNNGGTSGFDTHGSSQSRHAEVAKRMSDTIATFYQGLADEDRMGTHFVIASAFGRNPGYNGRRGTDHLSQNGHYTLIGDRFKAGFYGKATNDSSSRRTVFPWAVNFKDGATKKEESGDFIKLQASHVLASACECLGMSKAQVGRAFPGTKTLKFLKA